MDLDSDFNKARGFLVTYSTLVLLAWYFDAQLNSINLLGNSVVLQSNLENVWMVLSIGAGYFLLRYIQKLPVDALKPDASMIDSYKLTLYRMVNFWQAKEISKRIKELFVERNPGKTATSFAPWFDIASAKDTAGMPDGLYIEVDASTVSYIQEDGATGSQSPGVRFLLKPHRLIVLYSLCWGYFKSAVFKPWFSDFILPLIYGLMAILVAFFKWIFVLWPDISSVL